MADKLEKAKAAFDAAKSYNSDLHGRIREDLEFSNPADPQQWPDVVKEQRRLDGRPCQTFDYTNQYIMQVVNDQRMNKPGLKVLPVGSGSDVEVANILEGYFRHIEYASRAGIAYDTSIELAARVGLGWLRVVPEIVDPETNEQEIRIKRVVDSRSIMLNPDSTEPDGSDATEGHVELLMSRDAFKRKYPKAKLYGNDRKGWYSTDEIRVCEYFEVVSKKESRIAVMFQGERITLSEDEYWKLYNEFGVKPEVVAQFYAETKSVEWTKYCGDEVFEETKFPSIYIPLVPVLGYESFIDGTRYICGLTRRMMDGQKAYNVARTAEVELASMSPKQPWLVDSETVDAYKNEWANANAGGRAYLPYKARSTENGEALPPPQRIAPAPVSQGYLQLAQASLGDIEASVGMYRANLGQTSNETSGKAINARQRQGSIANYHYVDNQARSMEQVGRIILSMIPHVIDVDRIIQCLGEDGAVKNVRFSPDMSQAVKKKGATIIAVNPNIGSYNVRVKVGPGYASMRQEAAEQLGQLMSNPALAAIVGPIWARMQDWPEADKLARMLLAMAPPPVQQASQEEGQSIPPEVQAQMQSMKQQLDQANQVIQQLHGALTQAQQEEQTEQAKLQLEQEKNQLAAQKNQIEMSKVQMQYQAHGEKQQAESYRSDNKHMTSLALENAKQNAENQRVSADMDIRLQIAQMQTDTQKQIADLTQMVNLMIAHIDPPQPLAQEVSEDMNDNEMGEA